MRLFVAVVPPAEAVTHLQRALEPVSAWGTGLRWGASERWHVSLAFLGEVDDARRVRLGGRLARAAGRHSPLTVQLRGAGTFPRQAAKARVLWTGVDGDRAELDALAGSISAAARHSGIGVDEQPYHPHLTLARTQTPLDLTDLVDALSGYVGPSWPITDVHLVRSHLGATPRHERLDSWPLAGSPAVR